MAVRRDRVLTGAEVPAAIDASGIGRIFRAESGRSVATLIRVFGDIDLAEDAVQDAFAAALHRWPEHGVPPNPGAWITTTARNRAIDRLRRVSRGRRLLDDVARLADDDRGSGDEVEEVGSVDDDRLRLVFTCCHPALSTDAQVALTLRLLGGLTTPEVARAFLVAETTMAQRLVRAKRKIRAARIPYRVPRDAELPGRLPPVLAVVYLVYTTGADRAPGDAVGDDLRAEALRLARLLVALLPDEPEVAGLLALLLLTEARRPARHDASGALVLLRDQDRRRWDADAIAEGHGLVRACLRRGRPGIYQIQAAIGAVHTDAATFTATDWRQIVVLYDQMAELAPGPVVDLHRAIAVGELAGPQAALDVVDDLALDGYHPFHATRADLLRRLGRRDDARAEYERAAATAPSAAARDHLAAQAAALSAET